MDDHARLLKAGIAAARAGRADEARRLLLHLVRAQPGNETAWLWLSQVAVSDAERRACIERVLEINPANQMARAGLAWLDSRGQPSPLSRASLARDRPAEQAPRLSDASSASVPLAGDDTAPSYATGWAAVVRSSLGIWLAPLLAVWVNARFGLAPVTPAAGVALALSALGSYLWASSADGPHNPGMRWLFGGAGLDSRGFRWLIGALGVVLWCAAFGVILMKV